MLCIVLLVTLLKKLLKLTLPVPLSYCDLVIFYNYFTISQEIHTQYILNTTVLVIVHTWEDDGKTSCSVMHKKRQKDRKDLCNPLPPQTITNTQLPKESDQFTAAQQVSAILLSYSNSVRYPNPLQLLREAC